MNTRLPCSAVIIARNEELNIGRAISSLKPLFTDIVVVDILSRDGTANLARQNGARVFETEWKGYGWSRNFGGKQAVNDWIFSLDADEEVNEPLLISISRCKFVRGSSYLCRRLNYVRNRRIKYGFLGPEWKLRLYHRKDLKWDHREVHEQLISQQSFTSQKLKGAILHHAVESIEDYKGKLEKYAMLNAKQWINEKYKPGFLKRVFSPTYHFMRSYIFQWGILEGRLGLELSLIRYHHAKMKMGSWKEIMEGKESSDVTH
jgi:glycosyltransferase involved in cell wall biosynthesis